MNKNTDSNKIREAFVENTLPNFLDWKSTKDRFGMYENPIIEDHWNTFQEGFESAIKAMIPIINAFAYDKQDLIYAEILRLKLMNDVEKNLNGNKND